METYYENGKNSLPVKNRMKIMMRGILRMNLRTCIEPHSKGIQVRNGISTDEMMILPESGSI